MSQKDMSRDNEIVMSDVSKAGIIISEQIYGDVKTQRDLSSVLRACAYDDDFYNPGHPYTPAHPSEVEVVDSWELPSVLTERYNVSRTAICGMFPEIRRAWASIDNYLFLWRFDKWDSHCLEYSVDEHAICIVGLAKVKAGVFVEAIQYLLILATPVELIIAGVCCSTSSNGIDPYAQVSLQPLPYYKVPSDGVTMTCISCTDRGHIFLGGHDGHIYELQYSTGLGLQERCRKVCLTAGLGSVISRWVVQNVFKFRAVDPIVEMVVDNERHILYARTEEMEIQVFSLGANGDGPVRKVAAERNLTDCRDSYGGWQPASSRTPESTKTTIVSISPLSLLESKCLHLVAVLSDGRRMYLSSLFPGENNSTAVNFGGLNSQNPSYLEVVTTRPAPPLGAGCRLPFGAASLASIPQSKDLSLKIESSYYSAGTLVLSNSSPLTVSSLLIVNRNSSHPSAINSGAGIMNPCPLREVVSSVPIEGRMLFVADVLPLPDTASVMQSLYLQLESFGYDNSGESCQKTLDKLWAKRGLSIQHILPRRRIIVFSTNGMMEVVFNRPVDILRGLLESNSPRSLLEDFFSRFGSGESAAMCLMLAARIIYTETLVSNVAAERAAEAYEDPKLVGVPSEEGGSAIPNTRAPSGGFRMGQVVQEEPFFSGAHEGLCLCSSRLLVPLWELPVFITKGRDASNNVIIVCRLPGEAMQILEDNIGSLEKFLRSRRNLKRGLYGCVTGLGDLTGSILIGTGSDLEASDARNVESNDGGTSSKMQRPYSFAELAAMEVRAMECIRQLLLRCSEALFLLQLLAQHHVTRLVQNFDANIKQALLQLTFNELVCSEEGDRLTTSLVSALVEDYTGADGVGTVDDIGGRLLKGCPSYYKESDHKVYLAVERLERAAATLDTEERENLAREAFNYLSKVPESADLRTVFKRFEDLRVYEAEVLLKVQVLDCFIKGEAPERKFVSPMIPVAQSPLDQASRKKYIRLNRTLIDLGLEDELLEYGGPDLFFFLQNAGFGPGDKGCAASAVASPTSPLGHATVHVPPNQAKYLELLARFYALKQQHVLAAHVFARLAERRTTDANDAPTLEQRLQYLSNAVVQAQSASDMDDMSGTRGALDNGLLDLLKGKLNVLQFQLKIKEELQVMASRLKASTGTSESLSDETSPLC